MKKPTTMQQWNTQVVLVETQGPANIGSVTRTMKNFGVNQLALVAPKTPITDESRLWACHGKPFLEDHKQYKNLSEAVANQDLVIGLSRRPGRARGKHISIYELHESLLDQNHWNTVSLVFGNEESGLTNEHLELCHHTCYIPTHATEGSMNLAHAVSVTLYELQRHQFRRSPEDDRRVESLASGADIKRFIEECITFLREIGYPERRVSLTKETSRLLAIAQRANLMEWEVRMLFAILRQVRYQWGLRTKPSEQKNNKVFPDYREL